MRTAVLCGVLGALALLAACETLIEHFVKIAHAIKQQFLGVLGLDAQKLLHHGCVGVFCRCGHVAIESEAAG